MLEQTNTWEQANGSEYVPDIQCPNWGEPIYLSLPTYSGYIGNILCKDCQSTVAVKIGGWQDSIGGWYARKGHLIVWLLVGSCWLNRVSYGKHGLSPEFSSEA